MLPDRKRDLKRIRDLVETTVCVVHCYSKGYRCHGDIPEPLSIVWAIFHFKTVYLNKYDVLIIKKYKSVIPLKDQHVFFEHVFAAMQTSLFSLVVRVQVQSKIDRRHFSFVARNRFKPFLYLCIVQKTLSLF